MKRMNMKEAERKYEKSAKDKREDKRGAEKILRQARKMKNDGSRSVR